MLRDGSVIVIKKQIKTVTKKKNFPLVSHSSFYSSSDWFNLYSEVSFKTGAIKISHLACMTWKASLYHFSRCHCSRLFTPFTGAASFSVLLEVIFKVRYGHFTPVSDPSKGLHILLLWPDTFPPPTHAHTRACTHCPSRPRGHFPRETSPHPCPSSCGEECFIEYSTFLSLQSCSYHAVLK